MKTIPDEKTLADCCRQLARKDADFDLIFRRFGTPPLWKREPTFATLVHIILEQQVSVASALSAFNKLREKLGGDVTPVGVLSLTDEELKAAYFSRQKIIYARDLAQAVLDKKLDLSSLKNLPDEAVKHELKKIKGIGDWTSDIYLLMALLRADVMPKGDLALHVAWQRLKNLPEKPNAEEFLRIAERWKPHRAVAARLLWHFYLSGKNFSHKQTRKFTKEEI
ncbi:MAG: DNA-3-methyladenine glycosylase 2 family protein [Acidobacteriota bacterium]|nr:DNA-3-methyladenine glycosylase 2 family protein [Acidobacteriota bacterium]